MFYLDFIQLAAAVVSALILDRYLGEVGRFHPLVGVGNFAGWVEKSLNTIAVDDKKCYTSVRIRGVIAVNIIVVPLLLLCVWIIAWDFGGVGIQILLLYFVLGGKSLSQHGIGVADAMSAGGLSAARLQVGKMVSRDVDAMGEADVAL